MLLLRVLFILGNEGWHNTFPLWKFFYWSHNIHFRRVFEWFSVLNYELLDFTYRTWHFCWNYCYFYLPMNCEYSLLKLLILMAKLESSLRNLYSAKDERLDSEGSYLSETPLFSCCITTQKLQIKKLKKKPNIWLSTFCEDCQNFQQESNQMGSLVNIIFVLSTEKIQILCKSSLQR